MQQRNKRMVGVGSRVKVAVGTEDVRLPGSILEPVQGLAMGFTDEGNLVGELDVNGLSTERQHLLGYKLIEAGMALLDGKLQVH